MNHIDKVFKHKLAHYHVEIPDGAWENVASRLPEPDKKFRSWWMLSSVFTVLLIAGVSSYFMADFIYQNDNTNLDYNSTQNNLFTQFYQSNTSKSNFRLALTGDSENSKNIYTSHYSASNKNESKVINSKNITQNHTDVVDNTNDPSSSLDYHHSNFNVAQRNHENMPTLYNELKEVSTNNPKNIEVKSPFFKEKQVKACPFVVDVQDKSVDVYFSHDNVRKVLTANPGSENYKNMRISTELPMYSFSAGARFGYNLSYRWNLHTGFNYSQINEKFEYVDPESNQTRIITIKDYVYENGKIIDSIVTEQTVLVPGTTSHTVYNKYRTFDIPVLGRYTLYANKYLSLSAVAGVYFNITMLQRGMILDPNNNKPLSLNHKDDEGLTMFKTQLGLTGYGAVSLAYHITNRLDFLLEPNIRMQSASMTNDQYPLDQRFNTYSISTGLRYKF